MSNRRKIPAPKQPAGISYMPYEKAVKHIGDCLADRTSYVAAVPPHMIETAALELASLPEARWMLDNASGVIIAASGLIVQIMTVLLGSLQTMAAVVTIPKTVPHARIRAALGDNVPADGSQDVIVIGDEADTVTLWPRLLTDALAVVDPVFAAQLAASDIANQS